MIPEWSKYFEVMGALTTLATAMAWWRSGTPAEDEMVAAAADTVLDAVSDADETRTVDCRTGRNWRDQITIQEAVELHEERELRGFGCRRN